MNTQRKSTVRDTASLTVVTTPLPDLRKKRTAKAGKRAEKAEVTVIPQALIRWARKNTRPGEVWIIRDGELVTTYDTTRAGIR
jgi:hypothetical protein